MTNFAATLSSQISKKNGDVEVRENTTLLYRVEYLNSQVHKEVKGEASS